MNLIFLLIGGFLGFALRTAAQGYRATESASPAHDSDELLPDNFFLARVHDPHYREDDFDDEPVCDPEAQEYLEA